jgi:hypothetical protein
MVGITGTQKYGRLHVADGHSFILHHKTALNQC